MFHLKLIFKTSEGTIDIMTSFQSNNTVTQTK